MLGVGGGIAAYKTGDLIRRLGEAGAEVQVAMTPAATRFITPLTLQALSRRPVASELLSTTEDAQIGHIQLAEQTDVVLIAPATANLIARLAQGMADDVVTATVLATRAPVVVCPSMNSNMLAHPAVRANIERLCQLGYSVIDPDSGELACGTQGPGRLPDAPRLLEELRRILTPPDLAGLRVLVSAGPTRESIDPVRFVTNRSSGRMGYAIAGCARRRGASVTIVSGPTTIEAPTGCELVRVETAEEMNEAMRSRVTSADVVIMVAAVADYRPSEAAANKIKKSSSGMTLSMQPTPDIISGLAQARGERILVGFAAETKDLAENARSKLRRKKLDLIVANDVSAVDSGFDVETNSAILLDRFGGEECTETVSKPELAGIVLDKVVLLLERKQRGKASAESSV